MGPLDRLVAVRVDLESPLKPLLLYYRTEDDGLFLHLLGELVDQELPFLEGRDQLVDEVQLLVDVGIGEVPLAQLFDLQLLLLRQLTQLVRSRELPSQVLFCLFYFCEFLADGLLVFP